MKLYGYADGDPVNSSDPFGLCPKSSGGDGKTEDISDCPKGSSGFYANEAASGRGGLINELKGAWATLNFDARAQLPENTVLFEFNLPVGPRRGNAIGGKITGFTKHGINSAISHDGVGMASRAILDAVKNPLRNI